MSKKARQIPTHVGHLEVLSGQLCQMFLRNLYKLQQSEITYSEHSL